MASGQKDHDLRRAMLALFQEGRGHQDQSLPGELDAPGERIVDDVPYRVKEEGEEETGLKSRRAVIGRLQEHEPRVVRLPDRFQEPSPRFDPGKARNLQEAQLLTGARVWEEIFFSRSHAGRANRTIEQETHSQVQEGIEAKKREKEQGSRLEEFLEQTEIGAAVPALQAIGVKMLSHAHRAKNGIPVPPPKSEKSQEALAAGVRGLVVAMVEDGVTAEELLAAGEKADLGPSINNQVAIALAVQMKREQREAEFRRGLRTLLSRKTALEEMLEVLKQMKPRGPELMRSENEICQSYSLETEQVWRQSGLDYGRLVKRVGELRSKLDLPLALGQYAGDVQLQQVWGSLLGCQTDAEAARAVLVAAQSPKSPLGVAARVILEEAQPRISQEDLAAYAQPAVIDLAEAVHQAKVNLMDGVWPEEERRYQSFISRLFYRVDATEGLKPLSIEDVEANLMVAAANPNSQAGEWARFFLTRATSAIPALTDLSGATAYGKFISNAQTPEIDSRYNDRQLPRALRPMPAIVRKGIFGEIVAPEASIKLQGGRKIKPTDITGRRTQDFLTWCSQTANSLTFLAGTRLDPGAEVSPVHQGLSQASKDLLQAAVRRELLTSSDGQKKVEHYIALPDVVRLQAAATSRRERQHQALVDNLIFSNPALLAELKTAVASSVELWSGHIDDPDEVIIALQQAAEASVSAIPTGGWGKGGAKFAYARMMAQRFIGPAVARMEGLWNSTNEAYQGSEKQNGEQKAIGLFAADLAASWCREVPPQLGLDLLRELEKRVIRPPGNKRGALLLVGQPALLSVYEAVSLKCLQFPESRKQAGELVGRLIYNFTRRIEGSIGPYALEWRSERESSALDILKRLVVECLPDDLNLPLTEEKEVRLAQLGQLDFGSLDILVGRAGQLQPSSDALGLPGLESCLTLDRQRAALAVSLYLLRKQLEQVAEAEGGGRQLSQETGDLELGTRLAQGRETAESRTTGVILGESHREAVAGLRTHLLGTRALRLEDIPVIDYMKSLLDEVGITVTDKQVGANISIDRASLRMVNRRPVSHPLIVAVGPRAYQSFLDKMREVFMINKPPVEAAELRQYIIEARKLKAKHGFT